MEMERRRRTMWQDVLNQHTHREPKLKYTLIKTGFKISFKTKNSLGKYVKNNKLINKINLELTN